MRAVHFVPGVLIALAIAASSSGAQTPAPSGVDVAAIGPQTGSRLPAFTLPDQRGRPQTLESLMGKNGLMLVFSRSADLGSTLSRVWWFAMPSTHHPRRTTSRRSRKTCSCTRSHSVWCRT